MLLIVACHFIIHFNWNTHHYDLMLIQEPGWTNALKFLIVQYGQVGVSIFFIISGYFLVDKTFKRRRIFKTWFQMFCYSSGFFITLLIIGVFYKYPTVIQPLMQGSELFRTIAASFFPILLWELLVHQRIHTHASMCAVHQFLMSITFQAR